LYVLHAGTVVAAGAPAAVLQPNLIWDVYGVRATVQTHPTTGKPTVTFIPPSDRQRDDWSREPATRAQA